MLKLKAFGKVKLSMHVLPGILVKHRNTRTVIEMVGKVNFGICFTT